VDLKTFIKCSKSIHGRPQGGGKGGHLPPLDFQNHSKFQKFDYLKAVFGNNLSNFERLSAFLCTN
jgi:hypothetical protein